MKKFILAGLMTAAVSQPASAWCKFNLGVGANLGYQSGGTSSFLWGACQSSDFGTVNTHCQSSLPFPGGGSPGCANPYAGCPGGFCPGGFPPAGYGGGAGFGGGSPVGTGPGPAVSPPANATLYRGSPAGPMTVGYQEPSFNAPYAPPEGYGFEYLNGFGD
jgi:hypothetical protein